MKTTRACLLFIYLSSWLLACTLFSNNGVPSNAQPITVNANASLAPWLTAAVAEFNATNTQSSGGKPIYVILNTAEAGQTVRDIVGGGALPDLWIPDAPVWGAVLADKGQTAFQSDCVSVAQSPLVIGMWKPLAQSLGWPGRTLGWLDVGSLAADASAWSYYSGGQFGDTLRLGHTHPGLAGTGASTLLALVQAAQSKSTEAVNTTDIEQPIVRASVGAFEAAVTWFSPNTESLGQTMRERGLEFLGAAVMYESTVIQYGRGDANAPDIIPIYPFEGTFIATHPACVNSTTSAAATEAAGLFRAYLLSEAAQKLALANGLRPVSGAVPIAGPLDAAHGVDVNQPAVVFPDPSVESLYAAQDLWQSARKHVNLVMLLDTSGSMDGEKIKNLRTAAAQFVAQMGEDDYLTLITFSTTPNILVEHARLGDEREALIDRIEGLFASGTTTLFDAIGTGAEVINRTTSPDTTNVMVVLSDGLDTASIEYKFDERLISAATDHGTTIFTIAYGSDADEKLLAGLATQTQGNYYEGDEANIAAIYEEMAAAFGGNVGVGR